MKIITQNDDLFGGKVYFSADANLQIRSIEKVYESPKGKKNKTTKDILVLNYVGKRQTVTARTEQVGAGLVRFGISSEGLAGPENPHRDVA